MPLKWRLEEIVLSNCLNALWMMGGWKSSCVFQGSKNPYYRMPNRGMARSLEKLVTLWVEWLGRLDLSFGARRDFLQLGFGGWVWTLNRAWVGWMPSQAFVLGRCVSVPTGQSWWVCADDCYWSSSCIASSLGIPPGSSGMPGIDTGWPFLETEACVFGQESSITSSVQKKI